MDKYSCPKCGALSGDSWSQCEGSCPVPCSPHFDAQVAAQFTTLTMDERDFAPPSCRPDSAERPVADQIARSA